MFAGFVLQKTIGVPKSWILRYTVFPFLKESKIILPLFNGPHGQCPLSRAFYLHFKMHQILLEKYERQTLTALLSPPLLLKFSLSLWFLFLSCLFGGKYPGGEASKLLEPSQLFITLFLFSSTGVELCS